MRARPDVLRVRTEVYLKAKKWDAAAETARVLSELVTDNPFGIIHLAYALHEMARTQDAWNALLPVADKFPGEFIISYNLACYACQLGDLKAAWQWLEKAIELNPSEVRHLALADPDLEPLWQTIPQI